LSNDSEIELSFQVPPNLDKIDLEFESELTNVTKQEKEKFRSCYQYTMRNHKDSHQFFDYYLRKHKGEYVFYMLGKNGEPQDDVNVRFNFAHFFMNKEFNSPSLTTDVDGKIFLGPLDDIYAVSANVQSREGQQSVEWTLNHRKEIVSYPHTINILEGEAVEIPFTGDHLDLNNFSLVRYANGSPIENCFAKAKFTTEEGFVNGSVRLQALDAGNYTLKLLDQGTEISVVVHKGTYWETDSFILKKHSLVELRENQNFIRISHVNISQAEESKTHETIKFKLNNF